MTVAYIRVSTAKQTGDGQRAIINQYAANQGIRIDKTIKETVSSRKKRQDRKVQNLIDMLESGDTVIVSEMSRLARSMQELFGIVSDIRERKATLIIAGDNRVIEPVESIDTNAWMFAVSIGAQLERELISERTKAALAVKREEGMKLGRPKGASKLAKHDEQINEWLDKGISKASIAKLLDCSRNTLYLYLDNRPKRKTKSANRS